MQKKIPILLGLFFLFFTVGAISSAVQFYSASSAPEQEPKQVMVTSITDTSAKIIWLTDKPTTGQVFVSGKNASPAPWRDERDTTGAPAAYTTHSVWVKNLQPSTPYEITIVSGKKRSSPKNTTYAFRTGPSIVASSANGFDPAYGVVKTNNGSPASGSIVVVMLEDSQPVSTLVSPSGSWLMPLSIIRTSDLSTYVSSQMPVPETIDVLYGSDVTSARTDTEHDAPVSDMVIGNTYAFLAKESEKTTAVLGSETSIPSSSPTRAPVTGTSNGGVRIIQPAQNSSIVSTRPLIEGLGLPGKTVTVTVGITKPATGKTTVNANGVWSYTPDRPLSYGKQSVTVTSINDKGKPVALTNLFTILKSGSQVLGDATPSATLEPTPTEATLAAQPMPEPGGSLPTILLVSVGIVILVGGIACLL